MVREGQKQWVRDITFLMDGDPVVDPSQLRGRKGLKHLSSKQQDSLRQEAIVLEHMAGLNFNVPRKTAEEVLKNEGLLD